MITVNNTNRLPCRFVHFCGFTGATVAEGRFGGTFVVAPIVVLG